MPGNRPHVGFPSAAQHTNYTIDRAKFDIPGCDIKKAYHPRVLELLYLTPPELPKRAPKSISALRKEMADAHPDRGGNRADFMAARDRYLAAKAMTT